MHKLFPYFCANFQTYGRWDLWFENKSQNVLRWLHKRCWYVSLKAEWTLENLLKVGEGNKAWRCDWELRKQNDGSKFNVPADESLKGSVIQVLKGARQIFFQTSETSGDNQAKRDAADLWQAGTSDAHAGATQGRRSTGHGQAPPLWRLLHTKTSPRCGQVWQSRRPNRLPVDHRQPQVGVK